jgi:hypothetical protein
VAANTNPIFELTPFTSGSTFMNADSTNKKTIYSASAAGGRIDSISICSDASATINLAFYINDTISDLYIGNVPVPPSSGYLSVAKVEGLSYLKPPNQTFLQLKGGYSLKCNSVSAVSSGSTVSVIGIGGDF